MKIKDIVQFSSAHKRPENQDRCFYLKYEGEPDGEGSMSILCVLDGVSQANGSMAVRVAVPAMLPVLSGLLGKAHSLLQMDDYARQETICGAMSQAICAAHQRLQLTSCPGNGCGTTVTMLTVFDDRVYAANVGDSPAYLLEIPPLGGAVEMTPLFQCHNQAGEAVRLGTMTPEEARTSPLRNGLLRMVGSMCFLPGDVYTTTRWLGQQNLLLLGSDGALSVLSEQELQELMSGYPLESLEELTQKLFERIQMSKSTDNFTVLVLGVDTDG